LPSLSVPLPPYLPLPLSLPFWQTWAALSCLSTASRSAWISDLSRSEASGPAQHECSIYEYFRSCVCVCCERCTTAGKARQNGASF
jgi:hypothetical protein